MPRLSRVRLRRSEGNDSGDRWPVLALDVPQGRMERREGREAYCATAYPTGLVATGARLTPLDRIRWVLTWPGRSPHASQQEGS